MSTQLQAQYIICRDKLPTQVTVTHGSLDAAKAEAEWLARKQNDRFMVFELIGVVAPAQPPLAWTWRREATASEHFDDARVAAQRDLLYLDDLGDDWMGDIDPTDGESFGAK
ncbi:MAG: hypothetical protein WA040_19910 [Anaerolineae bacterium]